MTISRSGESTATRFSVEPASMRIIAIDLARFLAIVGMMGAHLLQMNPPAWALAIDTGFPSTLFAVLGGVSSVLATRKLSQDGRRRAAAVSVALRGMTVAFLGLLLLFVPSFVIPVLLPYGVALVFTALLLATPTRILLVLIAALAIAVQPIASLVSAAMESGTAGSYLLGDPLQFLGSIFFVGPYPAATWLAYQLIGVLVGRLLLTSTPRSVLSLALAGAAMTVAGAVVGPLLSPVLTAPGALLSGALWQGMLGAEPHSGSLTDVLRTAGVSSLVIAALLLATSRLSRSARTLLDPLVGAGSAPLTIYIVHILGTVPTTILLMTGSDPTAIPWWCVGPEALALNVVLALAIGLLLARLHRRGPLETLVSAVARLGLREHRARRLT